MGREKKVDKENYKTKLKRMLTLKCLRTDTHAREGEEARVNRAEERHILGRVLRGNVRK